MKLTWLTDLHLNFLEPDERQAFYHSVQDTEGDAIVMSGDVADGRSLGMILDEMANSIKKKLYFVLGNHDYYGSSIKHVRKAVEERCGLHPNLHWLMLSEVVHLSPDTVLIGSDGWADGRYGDYQNSAVKLNDSVHIAELFHAAEQGKAALLSEMQTLADEDAATLSKSLKKALNNTQHIVILTHIPPFAGACWYGDKLADINYLPFFASKTTGDVIDEAVLSHPDVQFTVLCGHTHSKAQCKPQKNLLVRVGSAEYYQPCIEDILEVE